jgi:hypothetical protein
MLLLAGCDASDAPDLTWDAPDAQEAFTEKGAPYLADLQGRSLRTRYGPTRPLGGGVTRAFATVDAQGTPQGLGVILSEKALQNLPQHGSHDEHMLPLQMPVQATGLFADHVSLDWNPHGHEPETLFGAPHFDVHFYTVAQAERATWTPADPQFEIKLERAPEAKYLPAGYVQFPGGVPMMGAHWGDSADPTYAPGGPAFTEVLLWGSYDGKVAFIEPMITTALLQTRPEFAEPIAQPEAVQKTGYYPTRYTIRHDAKRKAYVIALHDLALRSAS